MPGYINAGDKVGIGSAGGVNTSLNLMVNIKREAQGSNYAANTTNSNPVDLKKWFELFAISPGLTTGVYTNVKWSEFKQSTIFGCTVKIKNETTSRYSNSNNGAINLQGLNGSTAAGGSFNVKIYNSRGGTLITDNTFTGAATIGGGDGLFNSGTYYVLVTNIHPTGASISSMSFGFYWKNTLGGTGGQIRSDPTDANSFNNLSNMGQITISPTNQASGFSDAVTLLCKPQSFVNPGQI